VPSPVDRLTVPRQVRGLKDCGPVGSECRSLIVPLGNFSVSVVLLVWMSTPPAVNTPRAITVLFDVSEDMNWKRSMPGTAVLVVLAAVLAAKLAGPVLAAVAELLHVFLIVAGVIVGVGAASLVGLLAWRWRRWHPDAARAMPPLPTKMARAAQPLPKAWPVHALPTGRQRELPGELRLHFHGVPAEEIAAVIRHVQGQVED
jgi:hypothetical protein